MNEEKDEKNIKLCDYCVKREAVIVMQKVCINRRFPSMRKFEESHLDVDAYWCQQCWDNYI